MAARSLRHAPWLILVLLLLAFGAWAVQLGGEGPWLEVQRRDLVVGIPFEGDLRAVDSLEIGPPQVEGVWSFKVSFLAEEGKEVRAGQPVLRLDTTELQRRLQQEMAEQESAEKKLQKKEQDLQVEQRRLELRLAEAEARWRKTQFAVDVPAEVVSRRQIEEAKIDQRLAQLEIDHLSRNLEAMAQRRHSELSNLRQRRDRAAAKVEALRQGIQAMTVKAPRDGTVIMITNWRQQKTKVGDQVWRGSRVLEIPDLSQMRVEAEVAEADAGRLQVGQGASFFLDAYPDREYHGRLVQIRRAVQAKASRPAEKVVKVTIDLETTDTQRMRPGMRLRGILEVERLENVVAIPNDAVFTGPQGVWVWTRTLFGKDRLQPNLGIRNGQFFQVLEGLEPGDKVLGRVTLDNPEATP